MMSRLEELCLILVNGSDKEKEEAAVEILESIRVVHRIVEGEYV